MASLPMSHAVMAGCDWERRICVRSSDLAAARSEKEPSGLRGVHARCVYGVCAVCACAVHAWCMRGVCMRGVCTRGGGGTRLIEREPRYSGDIGEI